MLVRYALPSHSVPNGVRRGKNCEVHPQRTSRCDRIVLIGLCWLYGRSEFSYSLSSSGEDQHVCEGNIMSPMQGLQSDALRDVERVRGLASSTFGPARGKSPSPLGLGRSVFS